MRQSAWKIRCYARREAPGAWVALCLDFDLAAQGETFEEARNHLDGMITEYVADALTGPDRDHAASLLNRRAPWRYWLHYYLLGLVQLVRGRTPASRQLFQETLPLAVAR
jgi:hypothetical protein